jgi:hypothetical protein
VVAVRTAADEFKKRRRLIDSADIVMLRGLEIGEFDFVLMETLKQQSAGSGTL